MSTIRINQSLKPQLRKPRKEKYDSQVKAKTKDKLTKTYQSLNPAQLKREIDQSLSQLHQLYQAKRNNPNIEPMKKQTPVLVRNYMIQPN